VNVYLEFPSGAYPDSGHAYAAAYKHAGPNYESRSDVLSLM
jgi:hypothetical protein